MSVERGVHIIERLGDDACQLSGKKEKKKKIKSLTWYEARHEMNTHLANGRVVSAGHTLVIASQSHRISSLCRSMLLTVSTIPPEPC